MPQYTMHVISHTHWDREWYLTFQLFRMRLVDLMDRLLDILDTDPSFKYFNFDGQTIVLEDYLQIRPEKKELLKNYIKEGRILVGPWYQLNDEFLVSGESTVRSLLIGHRIAQQFGDTMKIGYLPDQFGNISQMPQILNGFTIDNAIFGRGRQLSGDRKSEFYWDSPDGSRVLASFMAYWYNNAQRFPSDTDQAIQYTVNLRDTMKKVSHLEDLLFMNGVDHLEAQPDVGQIIDKLNGQMNGDKLVHSTLPAYIDAIKNAIASKGIKLGVHTGEMREDHWNSILAGTLSARIYLKQANERSQTALEKYAEPASSFAYILGRDYPQDFLTYAWKFLMQNHPHDSICGCSVDQVHYEMMPRFDQVEQIAGELTKRAYESITEKVKTEGESVVVFNSLNWPRTDKVKATIDFALGEPSRTTPTIDTALNVVAIRIFDNEGNEVPYNLISTEVLGKQVLRSDELPHCVMTKRFVVEFVAEDVPASGYKTYRIEKCNIRPKFEGSLSSEAYWDNALANDFIRLSIRNGALTLERLSDDEENPVGDIYGNLSVFEDGGDVGDEYNYLKPIADVLVTSLDSKPKVSIIERGPISSTFKVEWKLKLPAETSRDSIGRSDSVVDCPITSYFTVTRGVPRVDVVTTVDNHAKDHRLRVLFPTGIDTTVSYAEGQFDVLERNIGVPKEWVNASSSYPQQRWVDVNDGERGLCIINKGLTEYEVYKDEAKTIALSLLRCVGRLSGGSDAPGAELTPGAQCLGEYTFEYSIYPHAGSWDEDQVWKQAHQHNIPLYPLQTSAHDGDLPTQYSFLETSHTELIVSAIKKAEDSDMLVVRFYNTTDAEIKKAWIKVNGAKSAKLLNMNEEVIGDVQFSNSTASLNVGAKKIVTLGFGL